MQINKQQEKKLLNQDYMEYPRAAPHQVTGNLDLALFPSYVH